VSDVISNVDPVHTLLIKPVHTFDATLNRRGGRSHDSCRRQATAKEVEAVGDATDEGLVGVLLDLQFSERLVDASHGGTQFPACRKSENWWWTITKMVGFPARLTNRKTVHSRNKSQNVWQSRLPGARAMGCG
jgi:hypothetical protein